jgi:hypothetical protein
MFHFDLLPNLFPLLPSTLTGYLFRINSRQIPIQNQHTDDRAAKAITNPGVG